MNAPVSTLSPLIHLIDDDEAVRASLALLIGTVGLRVQTWADPQSFMAGFDRASIGAIVLDVRMPGMSGLETLRRVRQKHPDLPVLLVTAFADIRSAVTAMRDGAVNYLAKPIDLDETLARVQTQLRFVAINRELLELQTRLGTFFGVKLDGKDISLRYRPGKGDAVLGGGGDHRRVGRIDVIAVHEIKARIVLDAVP